MLENLNGISSLGILDNLPRVIEKDIGNSSVRNLIESPWLLQSKLKQENCYVLSQSRQPFVLEMKNLMRGVDKGRVLQMTWRYDDANQ